ncbi:MAG: phosphatidylserine decarboxylase, partial [Acetobacteraceae bacterium]
PVDGTLGACGVVTSGTLLQVKGRAYNLSELLGSEVDAARFEGGHYITLYLAPPDYHRIHAPVAGQVRQCMVIPGRLMPVFAEAVAKVDDLFARNERLITYIDTAAAGKMAVVKVGATLVGRITLAYDPTLWTNQPHGTVRRVHYSPPKCLDKGQELGTFELGSSVVLLFEPGQVQPLPPRKPRVRLGEPLARLCTPPPTRLGRAAPKARRGPRRQPRGKSTP